MAHRSPLLLGALAVAVIACTPASAEAAGPWDTSVVDGLWNKPEAVEADSALYVVQSAFDQLARQLQGDQMQRGLMEIRQANGDLLSVHTVLTRQRRNPGPQPVPVLDPFLSAVYGAITGQRPAAPLGGVLAWLNQLLLSLEGRGSLEAIVENLLNDFDAQERAADRDLRNAGPDMQSLWTLNSERQGALLAKIARVAGRSGRAALTDLLSARDLSRQELLKVYATVRPGGPPVGPASRPSNGATRGAGQT